ncbi:MAG: GldG family protein [Bacteroidetes bacterium]|nr:GldG family protein [Bacteroidota bacterium]
MLTKQKVFTTIALIFGILLLINIVADRFFVRLDFTEGHQYTLSKATDDILKSLDAPVTVTAYFSENLPPDVAQVKNDFKDMLIEYSNESDGKVVYDFINPNKDQAAEMKAQQAGIQPVMINVRERDQMKQQRAYLGAVLEYRGRTERIPLIQPGSAMEYALSSTIKKLSLKNKTKIAFLQGNGEPSLPELQQLNEQLSILYDVNTVQLTDTTTIPADYKTLVIVSPQDTIAPDLLKQLDDFLSRGGRILVALDRVKGNLQNATGSSLNIGLSDWLKNKGVDVEDGFVIDANCGSVMVRQQQGMFVMNTPVRFPYLPMITKFADHPITKGIVQVLMPFVSPIKYTSKDSLLHFVTLASTSDKAGIQRPPVYFEVTKQWTKNDFPVSSLSVAVAVDGKIENGIYSKMVVFGNGDFATNGSGQNAQRLEPDNVNLMANAIDWLSDDTGLISLRTKGINSRPIKANIEESTKVLVKYLNFLLPILLIIAYGIFRYQRRRRLKNKWMNEIYG